MYISSFRVPAHRRQSEVVDANALLQGTRLLLIFCVLILIAWSELAHTQAFTDTDGDALDDDWEERFFGDLSRDGTADFDSDGMLDAEEFTHGYDPTVEDGLEDSDGDRYPNAFELRNEGDPSDATIQPHATYVVDASGGGDFPLIGEAIAAANVQNGTHQIIAVSPGIYTGPNNTNLTISAAKPKLLIIGTAGAAETIIDGEATNAGLSLQNTVVLASLTVRKTKNVAIRVHAISHQIRLVDLLLLNNEGSSVGSAVHVQIAGSLHLVGSTLMHNTARSALAEQFTLVKGSARIVNTVVWGHSMNPMLYAHPTNADLTVRHSLVKGQNFSGPGNLDGSIDPKLRLDGRPSWDSPLFSAGSSVSQSRLDIDLETRPQSAPDIGVDQWVDTDSDQLADAWERKHSGDLTTLNGRPQDYDGDGLDNGREYMAATSPLDADTDEELRALGLLPDPLSPVPGVSTVSETRALASALSQYQLRGDAENITPLAAFVEAYSNSRWLPSLLLNLGMISHDLGYFVKALQHWKRTWEMAKDGVGPVSQRISNRALAEYARMNARVGRTDELDWVFAEAMGRRFMG